MANIEFKNQGVVVPQSPGGRLKDACLAMANNPLPLGCQKGRCGTCLVRVVGGRNVLPSNEIELSYLRHHRIDDGNLRLGCQVRVNGDVIIETLQVRAPRFEKIENHEVVGPFPEIGFSTNVLDNPADVLGAVDLLSQNFKAIELELGEKAEESVFSASPREYEKIVDGIRSLREERRVYLSIHAPYLGLNLASSHSEVRKDSQDKIRWAMKVAADLGADKVTCHPGYSDGRIPEETIFPLLKSLEKIMPEAARNNITLCLENMGSDRPDCIVYSAEQQETICKNSGVRVALDVVHLASVCDDKPKFDDELARLIPFVGNVHCADMQIPKHVHIPIGEGNLPLPGIISKLRQGGYQGPAIVEEFGGPYVTQVFIDRAIQFRNHLSGGNECQRA